MPVQADLILIHAPSVFDFRNRSDVLFPYVASDSVAVSSAFEIYPLGFKSIETYLRTQGFSVRIVNLAALMLKKWDLDVPGLLASCEARVFGIDLHWVIHAHGSLALAKLLKSIHPRVPTLFGGISSTHYADELIAYPQVDLVLRGYDTHLPLLMLLQRLKSGGDLSEVPNLVYKAPGESAVRVNPFDHHPRNLNCDAPADWSSFLESRSDQNPAMMVLPSSGCAHNCGWCGGSRDSMKRIMKVKRTVAHKPRETLAAEMQSMQGSPAARRANIYTLSAYNFSSELLDTYIGSVKRVGIKEVSYEQFHLTGEPTLRKMVDASQTTINLSPESHDVEISRLAGRGNYTVDEMEAWIERALGIGVHSVNVWFFIGMPKQTESSVFDTVEYSKGLMRRFKGKRVFPLLTPMVPFLDPGCNYFEDPETWGYRVFHHSLEEHRAALVCPRWVERINYETRWLSRDRIASISYEALDAMTAAKGELGLLPRGLAGKLIEQRAAEQRLVFDVAETYREGGRDKVVADHGRAILAHNAAAFGAGAYDQLYPIPRKLDNRWFDEFEI
jgi:clorobiocin biosynthesis protein CloN6